MTEPSCDTPMAESPTSVPDIDARLGRIENTLVEGVEHQ